MIGPATVPPIKETAFNATTLSTVPGGARSIGRARLAGIAKDLKTLNSRIKAKIGFKEVGSVRI